jgi:sterol desaturase/sphingolipid hydroxylase (fatty acid hydroxylase superfamily)
MRLNAKTTGVLAVASAILLAGIASVWLAIYLDSFHTTYTLQDIYTYSYDILKAVGSTSFGRVGVVVAFVLIAEIFFVGWRGSSLFRLILTRSKSAILDVLNLILVLLNLIIFLQIALTLGASVLASKFIGWVAAQYGWSRIALPSDGIFEISISFAIYWLATSFVQYWGHRLMHTPMFWHAHRFHHAATELNMVTNFRQHPLEPVVLGFLSLVSPLIFLDVPQRVLLIYFFVATITELLAHSQLPWGYGWIGRWVIQSPRVHQVHHSIEDEHQHLHFSNCPLWDHVFGTWYKGTKQPSKFGIVDPAYEKRPLTQIFVDAWIFYTNVVRWLRSPLQRLRVTSTDAPPAGEMKHP